MPKKLFQYTPIPELRSAAESQAMTPDESLLLTAQRRERSSRRDLMQSLLILGRFDEAARIAEGDPEAIDIVRAVQQAEAAPDNERCDCSHFNDTADYTRNPNAKPILNPAKNYLVKFRFWSSKYGKVVKFQECFKCGHQNAIPSVIEPREN